MGIKEIHIEFTEQQIKKYNGLIPAFGNFHTADRNLLKLCYRITYLPKELEKSLVHPDEAVESESGQILGNQSSLRLSSLAAIVIHLRGQSETARLAAIEAVKGLKLLPDLAYDIFYDLQQQYEETRLPICKVLYRVKEYLHEDLSKTLAYLDENDDPVGRENFLLLFTYRQNHTVPISTIKFMIWKFRQCHGVNSHSLRSSLGNAIGTHIADTGLVPIFIKILCNDVAEIQIAFLMPFFATQSVSNRTLEMLLPLFDSPFDIRCHGIRQLLDLNKRPNLQQRVDVQRVLLGNMWRASETRPTRKIVLKMVQLLFHDDPIIREVAGNILAKHESDEYLHIFARLLRDSDIDVSDMAYDVLRNLSKRFKLPATCIDIFRALFDDKSIDVEVKTLVFEILSDYDFGCRTNSARELLAVLLQHSKGEEFDDYIIPVLTRFDDLSGHNLGYIMLQVPSNDTRSQVFELFLSRCNTEELQILLNDLDQTIPFYSTALHMSWTNALSMHFINETDLQISTSTGVRTIKMQNPKGFLANIKKSRQDFCKESGIEPPLIVENANLSGDWEGEEMSNLSNLITL